MPTSQDILAGLALILLGVLSVMMTVRVVPVGNHDYMLIMLGALAGALTVSGGGKIADKINAPSGSNATITDQPTPAPANQTQG